VQTLNSSPSLRGRVATEPLTAREIDTRARAIWENIAGETGTRRTHAQKVARLYLLCRDIQQAVIEGARFQTVRAVLDLIALVIARSYGMQPEAA
jgi:hypothetical protein